MSNSCRSLSLGTFSNNWRIGWEQGAAYVDTVSDAKELLQQKSIYNDFGVMRDSGYEEPKKSRSGPRTC